MAESAPTSAPALQAPVDTRPQSPATLPVAVAPPLIVPTDTQTLSPVPPQVPPVTPIPVPFTGRRLGQDKKSLALVASLAASGLLGTIGSGSGLGDAFSLAPSGALELHDLAQAQQSPDAVVLGSVSGQFDSGGSAAGGGIDSSGGGDGGGGGGGAGGGAGSGDGPSGGGGE